MASGCSCRFEDTNVTRNIAQVMVEDILLRIYHIISQAVVSQETRQRKRWRLAFVENSSPVMGKGSLRLEASLARRRCAFLSNHSHY